MQLRDFRHRSARLFARAKHLRPELCAVFAPRRSFVDSIYFVRIVHVDTMPDASYELNMTWPVAYSALEKRIAVFDWFIKILSSKRF